MSSQANAAPAAALRLWPPLIFVSLLAACMAASLVAVPYLPTQDGPQHIFTVHVANHLDQEETGWSAWFEPNVPLTNHGFSMIFGPLDAWLPWRAALRASLALMALLWAASAFAFAQAVQRGRAWLGLALAAGALQWNLYMGLFSFHVATAFGLLVLALAFGTPSWERRHRALLAVLLLLQALLHLMSAVLTGIVVAVLALLRAAPGQRWREALSVALMGAPAALVSLAVALLRFSVLADDASDADGDTSLVFMPWWVLGKCFLGGPTWRAWPLTLLAAAAPVAALTRWRGRMRAEDRALVVTGVIFLVATLALPRNLPLWDFFSVRFIPLAVSLLVVSWPLECAGRVARTWVAAICVVFGFAATGWAFAHHRDLAARAADALAGLDSGIKRDGPRLPIVVTPLLGRAVDNAEADMPFTAPLFNLGKLYATAQGGFVPDSFVFDRGIHTLRMREEAIAHVPETADPRYVTKLLDPRQAGDLALREAIIGYLAAHGTRHQDVILWGDPKDADYLVWLGFVPEWRRGGLIIARFEGCPLTIVFTGEADLEGSSMMLELGWFPSWGVTHRYPLGRAHRQPDGTVALPIRQSCGAVWFRLEDASAVCEGADGEGRLVIRSTRETPVVECRLRGPARGQG